jgi:hypothetical protein
LLPEGAFLFVQLPPHIDLAIEDMEACEVDQSDSPCSSTAQSDTECESEHEEYDTERDRGKNPENSEQYAKNPEDISEDDGESFYLFPIG